MRNTNIMDIDLLNKVADGEMTPAQALSAMENRMNRLSINGIDTDRFGVSFNNTNTPVLPLDDDENRIYENGYVRNTRLHRRFVMAQMFHALDYKDGFDGWLRLKGYKYSWDMVLEEVRVLSILQKTDLIAFEQRKRFFTSEVISEMMLDYTEELKKQIDKLDVKNCKGVPYKKIRKVGDVFVVDIEKKVLKPYKNMAKKIKYCGDDYREMVHIIRRFMYYAIPLNSDTKFSKAFINAYKANGAYYTLDNMIKFHNCMMEDANTKSKSLEKLDIYTDKLNICTEGYKLLGLLKNTIRYNNFGFPRHN